MQLDPNIILQAGQNQTNPLQMAGQVVALKNGLTQNQLLQNENQIFEARRGAGQLVSQAIDPQTGQFDRTKYNALLAQNPGLAPYAMEALQQGNAASTGQSQAGSAAQTLSQDKIKTYQSHLGLLSEVLAPLGTPDAMPTKSDAYKAASKLISNPDLDPETRQQLVGDTVQFLGDLPDDPVQIKQRVKQMQLVVQDASARLAAMTGQTGLTNTGSEQVPVTTNSYTGSVTRGNGEPIANTMTPGDASSLQEITNPDGSKSLITKGEAVRMRQGAPGAPGPEGQVGGAPPPSGGAPTPQPQAISTSLPVGEGEGITHERVASADQYAGLKADVGNSAARIFSLRQALHGLENAGSTGPGTDSVNNAKSFLLSNAPAVAHILGIDPNTIKNYDEANKYLTQYATGVAGSFGGHTDHQLAATLSGNASTHISNLASKDVVKANIALERMKQAQVLAFQQTGLPSTQFADWAAKWNTQNDPRAFLVDQLTAAQRKDLQGRLKPGSADYARFLNTYKQARDLGIISPNDIPK